MDEEEAPNDNAIRAALNLVLVVVTLIAAIFCGWWAWSLKSNAYAEVTLVSAADGVCKSLWVKDARNDPALLCYLQSQTNRLCSANEKQHLAQVFERYFRDGEKFQHNLVDLRDLPKQAAATNVAAVAVVMSAAGSMAFEGATFSSTSKGTVDPMESPELQDAMRKINDSYNAELKRLKTPALLASMAVAQLPRSQLVEALRRLGEKGYVQKSDFGWFPDAMIADALADVQVVKPACSGT